MPLTTPQIHIRASLTAGLLLCLILLSSSVSSKPVSSIKFPTLGYPFTAAKTTLNASTPTNPPELPPDVPLLSKVGGSTSGINGMSIFWVIMPLSLASMTHPIGSACGLEPAYRHRIRIGPLMSIFDTLYLLYQIYHRLRNAGDGTSAIRRIRTCTREVVEMRLHRHRKKERHNDSNPQLDLQTATILCRFEKRLYNTRIRHLFSAVLILQYAKLCGFHGIPMSFFLATGYFASWIIMEMILLVGEGRTAMEPGRMALPRLDSSSPPVILKLVGRGVFLFQSITILIGVFMLLWKAQSDFKFMPKHGETVPSFDLRFAVFLIISLSLMYWVDSMPLFIGISLMSGLSASSHKNSREVSNFIGIFMATAYVFIITTVFYSGWIFGAAHLLFVSYITYFSASRLFWPREGGKKREGCRTMARLEPVLIFGSSALTYAGGLLFFYVFVFSPEGTWKAGWTESFP